MGVLGPVYKLVYLWDLIVKLDRNGFGFMWACLKWLLFMPRMYWSSGF